MRDKAYLAEVRRLPCCLTEDCDGPVQAHHMTGAGLALKASDLDTMPLCLQHHAELHDSKGYFRHMDKAAKKQWQRDRIQETRHILGKTGA